MRRSAGSLGKVSGSDSAVAAMAGLSATVRTDRARAPSQVPIGKATLIRPCRASQASSYQVIAASLCSRRCRSAAKLFGSMMARPPSSTLRVPGVVAEQAHPRERAYANRPRSDRHAPNPLH